MPRRATVGQFDQDMSGKFRRNGKDMGNSFCVYKSMWPI